MPPRTAGTEAETTTTPPAETTLGTAITLARATGVDGLAEAPLTVAARAINVAKQSWQGMLVVALLLVALLMLLQMVVGMVGVWYVARRAEELTHDVALMELDYARDQLALERDVRLLRSSNISVPVIWGIFRPVLLLPADVVTWPADRLRVVLMHELAHLKRLDGISLIITRLAVSMFWYHPLAWSLERAGRSECERACDDLVLASGTKPSEYADHLLAIAKSMPTFDPFRSVTLAMSRRSQLEGRLLSILQPHVARRIFTARGVAMACALALIVVIPVSAMRLKAAPPQNDDAKNQVVYAKKSEKQKQKKSDSEITVTPDVEAIGDYFLAKLGKTGDRLTRTPKNGEDWYQRGYDLYSADRYAEAAVAFQRAATEDYRKDAALYNAACSYSLIDDKENALKLLSQAIEAGWDDYDHIADDSDLDPVRSDARFARVVNDARGTVATRRVTETMERYQALQSGVVRHQEVKKDGHKVKMKHKGDDWFDVGLDLLRLRKFDESISAFRKAIEAGEKPATSTYNLACAYSLKGDVGNGMAALEKSIELGFDSLGKLDDDPDIRALRTQPRFAALRQMAEDLRLRGCCDDDDENEASSWREAAAHHRSVAGKYPNQGLAWFNLGYTALQARDFPTSVDAFNRAIALNHRTGTSAYNIACAHALQGNTDAALQWLEKARTNGFDLYGQMSHDNDLDSLRDDPRFKEMKRRAKAEAREKHRMHIDLSDLDIDFDFDFDDDKKH
jgi:beta-lactamase regulating signal transducer with metallopeptidase domain/Flp pilus assembly protein TadD